jgi:predicted HTH transcriptional regulator
MIFPAEEEVTGQVTEKIAEKTVADIIENEKNVNENVTENRLSKMLKLISENNKISFDELSKHLSVARMTVYRNIEKL